MPWAKLCFLWITIVIFSTPYNFAQERSPADEGSFEKLLTMLLKAKTEEERTLLLTTNKEKVTIELQRALVKEASSLSSQGEYQQAFSILYLAKNVAEHLNDKIGIARTLIGIGIIYRLQGKYEQALEHFQKSLALSEEL